MQQLRGSKMQPLSGDESSQRCLFILQSQAGEGFRLPQVIWLWQLPPVATLLGEGERLWSPQTEVQVGVRGSFIARTKSVWLTASPWECPERRGEVSF